MKDVTLRIPACHRRIHPGDDQEINGYPMIAGYRGMKPKDEEALVELICAISQFFAENKNVVEFDINPVRLYESGACIVDARVFVDDTAVEMTPKERPFVPIEYFTPRSIAVVGASSEPKKMGYAVMHNLLHFPGQPTP